MRRTVLLAVAALAVPATAAPAAELVGDWRFEDRTNANVWYPGAGPAVASDGSCGFAEADVLGFGWTEMTQTFCLHQSLDLPVTAVDPADWSLAFVAGNVWTDGWRRLVGMTNGATWDGLNVLHGRLTWHNQLVEPGTLDGGPFHQYVITRDGSTGRVAVYVDGVERFAFTDVNGRAIFTAGHLRLFGSHQTGWLARARVWKGPLSAAEVSRLTRTHDWTAPSVSFGRAVPEADNRVYLEGTGSTNAADGLGMAQDLPVEVTVRDAAGEIVEAGSADVAAGGAWAYRTFDPLPAGNYAVQVAQRDEDHNGAVATGAFTVAQKLTPQELSGLPEGVRPATTADQAVWRTAETLRQWMHYLGEDALLTGLLRRNYGRVANGAEREWLTFRAPVPGRLFVRVGRLSRRSCCADVVGWTQVEFPEAGRKAFTLDRPVVTTKLPQGAEYWFSVVFRPATGPVARLGSQREVLTFRPNCAFTPDELRDDTVDADDNGCFIGNPCRLAPADRRDFDETCAEFRTRQKVLRENRRQRKLHAARNP